jgi:hypothetical protein
MMVHHNPLTESETRHTLAHLNDSPGDLMTEDARRGMGAGVDFLEICSADAAGSHFDQQFPWPDGGHRHGLNAHIIDAAVDNGPHGFGNPVLNLGFSV